MSKRGELKGTPMGPVTIKLTDTQRIALQNTMRLGNEARRQAGAQFDKQFQDVAMAAIRDAGHDPAVLDWTNTADFSELIGTPRAAPAAGPKQKP